MAASLSAPTELEAPPARVRLHDGRVYDGPLAVVRQRSLQLGLLHGDSDGYMEIAAGPRPAGGKVQIRTRKDPDHYLPGGATGDPGWLRPALALIDRHVQADEELFVGVGVRNDKSANKIHVTHANWLWVDIDRPDRLDALWAFLAVKPAHLVIESAGSGGMHAYWKLNQPLQARVPHPDTGELTEPIEEANIRLIHALGVDDAGKPDVADPAVKDRSRVMRIAGTRNYKTGAWARVVWADMHMHAWSLEQLMAGLPQPSAATPPPAAPAGPWTPSRPVAYGSDPYKQIPAVDYLNRLAGVQASEQRLFSCPNPGHADKHPSCSAQGTVFCCHAGCGARGGIYDAASLMLNGPTGRDLRGDSFKAAVELVKRTYGEL